MCFFLENVNNHTVKNLTDKKITKCHIKNRKSFKEIPYIIKIKFSSQNSISHHSYINEIGQCLKSQNRSVLFAIAAQQSRSIHRFVCFPALPAPHPSPSQKYNKDTRRVEKYCTHFQKSFTLYSVNVVVVNNNIHDDD